jgi:hypothetical protein
MTGSQSLYEAHLPRIQPHVELHRIVRLSDPSFCADEVQPRFQGYSTTPTEACIQWSAFCSSYRLVQMYVSRYHRSGLCGMGSFTSQSEAVCFARFARSRPLCRLHGIAKICLTFLTPVSLSEIGTLKASNLPKLNRNSKSMARGLYDNTCHSCIC